MPPLYTEPGWNMHTGAEIGIDEFQAQRSPDERYRTAPLRGLFSHCNANFVATAVVGPLQRFGVRPPLLLVLC